MALSGDTLIIQGVKVKVNNNDIQESPHVKKIVQSLDKLEPWKTQRRIRQVLDIWFDDDPLGLSGDEDGGAMCAWYVLSAIGFYSVTPGSGMYAIGSPLFEKVKIDLPDGKSFNVEAKNNSKENIYI